MLLIVNFWSTLTEKIKLMNILRKSRFKTHSICTLPRIKFPLQLSSRIIIKSLSLPHTKSRNSHMFIIMSRNHMSITILRRTTMFTKRSINITRSQLLFRKNQCKSLLNLLLLQLFKQSLLCNRKLEHAWLKIAWTPSTAPRIQI
jgi:hypothetical protein